MSELWLLLFKVSTCFYFLYKIVYYAGSKSPHISTLMMVEIYGSLSLGVEASTLDSGIGKPSTQYAPHRYVIAFWLIL